MTGSGIWLPAKQVMEACNRAMNMQLDKWRVRRERDIRCIMDRGEWSWRLWKVVPLSYEEAERQCMSVAVIDYFIGAPMNNDGYAKMQHLLALAAQAEALMPGASVFVSADDHWRIGNSLREILDNDNVPSAVSGSGDHHERSGEPRA